MNDVVLNCDECETCLLDLLEGRLSATEQAEVEAHLATCPSCQQRREEFAMTLETYGFSERPSPQVRMALYEAAREAVKGLVRRNPAWGRREVRYAWAALLVIGIGFLLRPLWHRSVTRSTPEPVGAISLPPPSLPDIKIEYSLQDPQGKSTAWMLDKAELRWLGPEAKEPSEVSTSDVDELIRNIRRLNLLPIPMLTKEPRPCTAEEASELIVFEFEGRKMKARLCSETHGEADEALRDFVKVFKDWTEDHTHGNYRP